MQLMARSFTRKIVLAVTEKKVMVGLAYRFPFHLFRLQWMMNT